MAAGKNPLRTVFIVVCIFVISYLFRFWRWFAGTDDMIGVFRANPEGVIGFLISISFIFAYMKQSIHAWWIVLIASPVVIIAHYTINPFELNDLYGIGVDIFILGYLINQYKPYKVFVEGCEDLCSREPATERLDDNGKRNPMRYLAVASIGILVLDLIYYTGILSNQRFEEVWTNHVLRVVQTVFVLAFLAAYRYKSIVAWWLCVIWGPLVWVLFLQSHSFIMFQFILAGTINICFLAYMICIYSNYLAYVRGA